MRYLFFIILCLFFGVCIAQTPTYSIKNKKAIEQYELGKKFILMRKYNDAALSFDRAIEKEKEFVEAYLALASCYKVLRDEQKVKFNLLSAFSVKPDMPEASYEYFNLASILIREGDYKNASFYVEKFFSFQPKDKRVIPFAEKLRRNCAFAEEAMKKPLEFSPIILPSPLNRFRNQYFPSLTADGQYMLYTVRNATGMDNEENLYYSEKSGQNWLEPQQVSTRINTKENEGASSISGDGKTLVYTYCTPTNGCDFYITKKVGKEWSQPNSLGGNVNSKGWESHPSLSADGRTLYFASERAGGFGREDIWVTTLDSTGNWTHPVNLGPTINSEDSEFTPFIHPNGTTLYFASRGLPGMGGSDLYLAEKMNETEWSKPKNLGYPLNTYSDELGITVSSDFKWGYFSKDVKNNQGTYISTLYSFQIPESIKSENKCVYLKGKVLNASTSEPIKAKIELINLHTGKTEQEIVSDGQTGAYLLVVPSKKNYGLFVSSIGFLYQSLNFNTEEESFASMESFDVRLKPIQKNSEEALRNLFFESNRYELDTISETELAKLANLIRDNNIKVEISGHTDNVGSPQDNLVLSQKRAQSVCNYLISRGIKKDLVVSVGYGEKKPIGDNATEEGRKINRRIEIKILN